MISPGIEAVISEMRAAARIRRYELNGHVEKPPSSLAFYAGEAIAVLHAFSKSKQSDSDRQWLFKYAFECQTLINHRLKSMSRQMNYKEPQKHLQLILISAAFGDIQRMASA